MEQQNKDNKNEKERITKAMVIDKLEFFIDIKKRNLKIEEDNLKLWQENLRIAKIESEEKIIEVFKWMF